MNYATNMSIVAAVVIVALAIATVFLISDDSPESNPAENDLIGHWYQVYETGYDESGNAYVKTIDDNPYLGSKDMDIYYVDKGLFNGLYYEDTIPREMIPASYYRGTNFSGTITDNIIGFGMKIDYSANGIPLREYTGYGIIVNPNLLALDINYVDYSLDGLVIDTGTFASFLTKDRSLAEPDMAKIDISGDWRSFSSKYYDGTLHDVGVINAVIKQDKALLTVTFDGSLSEFKLLGSMYSDDDGNVAGFLVGSKGSAWRLSYNGDKLTIGCATGPAGSVGSLYIEMTRDGVAVESPLIADLGNTVWRGVVNNSIDQYGTVVQEERQYYLEFGDQVNNCLMGTLYLGLEKVTFSAYLLKDTYVRVVYDANYSTSNIICSSGWIKEDQLYIRDVRSYGVSTHTSLIVYEKPNTNAEDYDILGHWYLTNGVGYNNEGEFTRLTSEDISSKYDLDVFGLKNGVLYGYFAGGAVTGSYIGGTLTISGTDYVEGGNFSLQGWIIDKNTLVVNNYFMNNGTSVYTTVFSRDLGGAINQETDIDILGDWTMTEGYVFDGELHDLSGTDLRIDEFKYNTFKGAFQRTIDDEIVWVPFKGAILSMTVADTAYGIIVDDLNDLWYVDINNNSIVMRIADSAEYITVLKNMVAVELTYTRVGTVADTDGFEPITIEGKWVATFGVVVTEDGKWGTESIDYSLTITQQEDSFALGDGKQGRMKGPVSLVMAENALDEIILHTASDYGRGTEYGYGWISETENGIQIYLVETYKNSPGQWCTQIVCLEKASE